MTRAAIGLSGATTCDGMASAPLAGVKGRSRWAAIYGWAVAWRGALSGSRNWRFAAMRKPRSGARVGAAALVRRSSNLTGDVVGRALKPGRLWIGRSGALGRHGAWIKIAPRSTRSGHERFDRCSHGPGPDGTVADRPQGCDIRGFGAPPASMAPQDIGQALSATHLLEGSVRREETASASRLSLSRREGRECLTKAMTGSWQACSRRRRTSQPPSLARSKCRSD